MFLPSTITINVITMINMTGAYMVAIFVTASPSLTGMDILVFVAAAR